MGTPTSDEPRLITPCRFTLVGGKGGVGKTTCAAAMAVAAAASGARTLVISTDPAPSLGDVFGQRVSASPTRIPLRRGSLHAVEIDAGRALDRWLARRRDALERIAVRGTWLDQDDVARLLRLSLPGIDEIAALLECVRFDRSGRFDRIIVDTAPTGHTLRMLRLPALLGRVAHLFDEMQEKHRMMVAALRGAWRPDAEDALIDELHRDSVTLGGLLSDRDRMEVVWVTLPEPMSVAETKDGIAALAAEGIAVQRVIVNRISPAPQTRCRHCEARLAFERGAIAALAGTAGEAAVAAVAAQPAEPRGKTALAAIGRQIAMAMPLARSRPPSRRVIRAFKAVPADGSRNGLQQIAAGPVRLLLFGGKGGVGKTTCAAAAAIELAAINPERRVLLLSTDPAHSLADVLGAGVSDRPSRIAGGPANLLVQELDAARRFARIRDKYEAAVAAVFDRLARTSSYAAGHDRAVMRDLIDLAPPGIDELAGVTEVTDALAAERPGAFDLVVMDMAPSGHALRLLETPAVVQDWAKTLMSMLLKYQPIIGVGDLGALLLELSQDIGRLRELLRDPRQTRFVAVTRAAAVPRAETARLVRRLGRLHVRVAAVLVNAMGRGTCVRCRREAAAEAREMSALMASPAIRKIPLVVGACEIPAPHGPANLRAWEGEWRLSPPRTPRRR